MLGIDVSKATLTGTLVVARDQRPLWEMTVPNNAVGIARLVQRTTPECPWVVEPTGLYSRAVVQQGSAAGRAVLMAQPKRAKADLASVQPRAKTDRVDSHGLALYGLAATLRPYPVKSEAMERIDQLLAARKGISRSLASLRQQRAVLPHAVAPLTAAITALTHEQAEIDRQIAAATAADAAVHTVVHALDGVPGIGPVTANAVASCLTTKVLRPSRSVRCLSGTRCPGARQRAAARAAGAHQAGGRRTAPVALPVRVGECARPRCGEPLQATICPGSSERIADDRSLVRGGTQTGADVLVAGAARHAVRGDAGASPTGDQQ